MSSDPDDVIPAGICTATGCACECFKPDPKAIMYCVKKKCRHSVEHHHLPAREIQA